MCAPVNFSEFEAGAVVLISHYSSADLKLVLTVFWSVLPIWETVKVKGVDAWNKRSRGMVTKSLMDRV